MMPWPAPWGAGREDALEEPGLSAGSDLAESWSSGEETVGEPGTPPQASPEAQPLIPSEAGRRQPPHPTWLGPEPTPETQAPVFPQTAWGFSPSTRTPSSPWHPNYQPHPRPQQTGASCGSGVSYSGRTLCHPSWPAYDTWGKRLSPGRSNGEQASRDAGIPVSCCEDVFLLDPLLPCGQRIPLYLSEPPQQATGSMKLLLPPPIMSPSVCPSSSLARSTWLSESELIALSGLLQMSQGEPKPGSMAAPLAPAGGTHPASDNPDPSGSQGRSGSTEQSPTKPPESNCP